MLNADDLRKMDIYIVEYVDGNHSKENKETANKLRWDIHKELRKIPIKIHKHKKTR